MFFGLFGKGSNQNSELDKLSVLERGVILKREGRFNESIKCYTDYIKKNPYDNNLNEYLYSLAKVYFLNKNYIASMNTYCACAFYLAYIKRPEMLKDLSNYLKYNDTSSPYFMWAVDFGRHIGYALIGSYLQTGEINLSDEDKNVFKTYCDSIAGKNVNASCLLNSRLDAFASQIGAQFITENIRDNINTRDHKDNISIIIGLALDEKK